MKDLPIEILVTTKGNELKTDSRKVAMAFGRRHDNVMRDIRKILPQINEEFNALIFEEVEYTDKKGEKRQMYEMTKDGFVLLTMGYTTPEAMKVKIAYIKAFNAMRRQLDGLNTSLISKLLAALEAEKQSAALASVAGRILRERRDDKPANQMRIEHYEQQIQPLLVGFEAA